MIISLDVDNAIFERLKQVADAGFTLVEVNTADFSILQELIKAFPKLQIGAGNITHVQQLESCHKAGVHFTSSPGFLRELVVTSEVYSLLHVPGIATLSEALQVLSLGLQYVRPLPASLSLCNLLNTHLPALHLIPMDVELDEAEHYLGIPSVKAVTVCNPGKEQLRALSACVV